MKRTQKRCRCLLLWALVLALLAVGAAELYGYPALRLVAANRGLYETLWTYEYETEDQTVLRCQLTEHDGQFLLAFLLKEKGSTWRFSGRFRGPSRATGGVSIYEDQSARKKESITFLAVAQAVTAQTSGHRLGTWYDEQRQCYLISEEVATDAGPWWVLLGYTSNRGDSFGTDDLEAMAMK